MLIFLHMPFFMLRDIEYVSIQLVLCTFTESQDGFTIAFLHIKINMDYGYIHHVIVKEFYLKTNTMQL